MHVLLDNSLKTASRNTHVLNTDAVLYTFTNIFSTPSHRDHKRRRVVWTMRFEATFSLCCICCAVWISKKKVDLCQEARFSALRWTLDYVTHWWLTTCYVTLQHSPFWMCHFLAKVCHDTTPTPSHSAYTLKAGFYQMQNFRFTKTESSTASFKETEWSNKWFFDRLG